MSYLTPEAKSKLSATIRSLRQRLLEDLQNAGEGTFRLSIKSANQAGLTEANRVKRQRLEQWLEMQVRGETAGKKLKDEQRRELWERQLRSLEKLAAATWLNRLVVIKQMEAMGLVKPAVVTGGWQSPAYREFREFAPDLCKDDTEGYGTLLQLLCDELALAMPGLFGKVSLTSLLPIPASTLRAMVEALDAPELKEIWKDDTTLGWVYQYWNDPEREGLDAKLDAGGKVEPHEIASKTQMFTERYMVEWLLQNSLGQLWLAMCQQQGWVAEAEADGTLARLEERRQVWREQREAGKVALDALMPIETKQEERWKYWVPQPLTGVSVANKSPHPLAPSPTSPHPLAPSPTRGEDEPPHPLAPSPTRGEDEPPHPLAPSPMRGEDEPPHPLAPSPMRGEGGQEGQEDRWEVSDSLREKMTAVARQFRKEPTASEAILWGALRGRKLENRKFRRQQPIGCFVVDFFCAAERLIVEVDGLIHDSQQTLDRQRQELLESLGLRVLRLKAEEVEQSLTSSLQKIQDVLNFAPIPHPKSTNETETLTPLSHPGREAGSEGLTPPSRPGREAGSEGLTPLSHPDREAGGESLTPLSHPGRGAGGEGLSLRDIKILDPACGSGHFLVIAVGLLFALYQEEGRHLGEDRSNREIVESILEHNLYGIDIDPRAVQIAAAALYLKAKSVCPDASPKLLNLVASNLQVAALPEEDPMLVELRQEILAATGIPEDLTNRIVQALKGADRWGSLLKVDKAVDLAVQDYGRTIFPAVQKDLFNPVVVQPQFNFEQAKASVLEKLEQFLGRCTRGDDLGLRLRGEQLTAGVRFIRMVQEDSYDLVVGNPPYQGASKMSDDAYLKQHYPMGKADLYAAFLERGLQLAKPGGISALLTMRNWMFISQYSAIREFLIDTYDLRLLGDLGVGAFEEISGHVVSVVMSIFSKCDPTETISIAYQPTLPEDSESIKNINRKRSAILAQVGRFEFQSDRFTAIKEQPIVYWWDDKFLKRFSETPKMEDQTQVRQGMATSINARFLRRYWEVDKSTVYIVSADEEKPPLAKLYWVPYIKGAEGRAWIESFDAIINWQMNGLYNKTFHEIKYSSYTKRIPSEDFFFRSGISYSTIGSHFLARARKYQCIFDVSGSSVFPENVKNAVCLMNSKLGRDVLQALNPTVNFQVGDVNRLPLFPIESADEIFTQLDRAFTEHEAARETSVEFKQPGTSGWNYAQAWAQQSVDRSSGTPLPDWNPISEQPPATNWVAYALGIALGRFGTDGEGILTETPTTALPHGILYLSAYSGDRPESKDSLTHPACQPLTTAWQQHGSQIATAKPLRDWLRLNFFKDIHVGMYEQRPIYFPLSSAKKNFVAYISIHRWTDSTLSTLLAEYLLPELRQLEGELSDLMDSRTQGDKKQQSQADDRYSKILQLATELKTFTDLVQQCAQQGAPPAKPSDTPRETAARFSLDLDDGVMVNSAALWPLLEPQWTKPKTWWSELATAQGKKDYDWSHLAARYFPQRVAAKCQIDPSLAVAHGCFWQYHPAKAYEWELRLQDEIGGDFTIDELDSDKLRQQFESDDPDKVKELQEKEAKRRDKKRKKADGVEDLGPLFEQTPAETDDE